MKQLLHTLLLVFLTQHVYAYEAPKADRAPVIDGLNEDSAWQRAPWANIDQLTLGEQPSSTDFSGRFKLVWTEEKLFILAEITDDVLIDTHANPLDQYWEDDTFEIFIDEDKSGGNHLENYNAMAYHIALDNQVVDIGMDGKPRLFNSHVKSQWRRSSGSDNQVLWEASIDIYPDTLRDSYEAGENPAKPVILHEGKKLGFLVAYCDADAKDGRQHFIGSFDIPAINGDKNRGYIDASVFDELVLIK